MAVKPPPLSHHSDSTLDSPGSLSPTPFGRSPSPSPSPSLLDSAFTPSLRIAKEGGGTGPPSPRGFGGGTPLPTAALSPRDLHPIKFFLTQSDAATCDDRDRARPGSRHAASRHSRHRTTSQDSSPFALPADERADVTQSSSTTPRNPILRELERLEVGNDEDGLGRSKSDGGASSSSLLHGSRASNPTLRELEGRASNPILRELESLEGMNRSRSVDTAQPLKTLERRVTNPIMRDLQQYDVSGEDPNDSSGLATAGLSPGCIAFHDFEKRVQPKQGSHRSLHRHYSLQQDRADQTASSDDEEGDVIKGKQGAESGSESGGEGGSSSSSRSCHVAAGRGKGEDVHVLPGLQGKLRQKLHSSMRMLSLQKEAAPRAAEQINSPSTGGAIAGKAGGFLGQSSPLRGLPKAHHKSRGDIFSLHRRGRKEEGRGSGRSGCDISGAFNVDENTFCFPSSQCHQPVAPQGPFPPPLVQDHGQEHVQERVKGHVEEEHAEEEAPELRKQETVPIQRPPRASHRATQHSMDDESAADVVAGGQEDLHSSGDERHPQVIGCRMRVPGRVLPSLSQFLQSPRHSFDAKEDAKVPRFGDSAGGAPPEAGRPGTGSSTGTASASPNVRGSRKSRLAKQDSFGATLLQRLDVLHARSLLRRHNSAAAAGGGGFPGMQASESCLRPEASLYRSVEGEEGFRTPPRESIRKLGLSPLNKIDLAQCQG